jgi:hypothetical protein
VLRAARSLARSRSISLGEAVSELARRGLQRDHATVNRGDFPLFHAPENARPITLEDVKRLEDEL